MASIVGFLVKGLEDFVECRLVRDPGAEGRDEPEQDGL